MIFLDERQVGYHSAVLGFPSIDGCHAVVLQTTEGLFGMHIVGGERAPEGADTGWDSRAKAFATYVRDHLSRGKAVHLYGTCFRTSKRGYKDPKDDNWKKEMQAHAKALKYKGAVSGVDLSKVANWPNNDSAYVEYRRVFDKCYIGYKPWHDYMKTSGNADAIRDKVNRKTTSTTGGVDVITVGKNHTIALTSNRGTPDIRLVLDADVDRFNI
jgi:hypothetical protein